MADTKISALSNALALGGTEQIPGVQSAANVNITPAQIKTFTSASPMLVTPGLGVATATSINKVTITAPASGSTLTIQDGFSLTVSGSATISGSPPSLGANTFTALQTITQAGANAGIIASTGYSLTGSGLANMVDLAGTWNTSGVSPIAFKLAITQTAAGGTPLLFQLLAGASGTTNRFSVRASDGNITSSGSIACSGLSIADSGFFAWTSGSLIARANDGQFRFFNDAQNAYFSLTVVASATDTAVHLGAGNAASPAAQVLGAQGSRSGTDSNVGGASLTIRPGIGTGTGTPSNLVLNGIVGATTGTGAQTLAAALTAVGVVNGQLPGAVVGSAALATNATDGFLYIPTCAGTPSGTPTTFTGRIPMIYDTTAHQFWFYDSGWKQPKTPSAAAIVTWQ